MKIQKIKRLSPAQVRFLHAIAAKGKHTTSFAGGSNRGASARAHSAWHRTCDSLVDRGLVTKSHSTGSSYYTASFTELGTHLAPCSRCRQIQPVCCGDGDQDGFNEYSTNVVGVCCCGPHIPFSAQRYCYPQG